MSLTVREEQGFQIVGLKLEYLDSSTVPEFKESLPYDQLSAPQVLLDLSDLQFIDSTGLGSIIGFNKKLLLTGQRLALVFANHQVESIFNLVKIDKIIPIFSDLNDAKQNWT